MTRRSLLATPLRFGHFVVTAAQHIYENNGGLLLLCNASAMIKKRAMQGPPAGE